MSLDKKVKNALTEKVVLDVFSEVKSQTSLSDKDQIIGLCPFHDDSQRSFSFNKSPDRFGVYHCFVATCGAKGNIMDYIKLIKKTDKPLKWLAEFMRLPFDVNLKSEYEIIKKKEKVVKEKKTVNPTEVLEAKQHLILESHEKLKELRAFGITDEIIRSYNIGYRNGRFWIPIKDETGDFVNVRKYNPNAKDGAKVISYGTGYGSNRLWPIENLNSDNIYIFEGEKDTLLALSLGLNSITNTTGAGSWNKDWGKLFNNKNVIICMDIDPDGEKGARIRADNISEFASQVKMISLPLNRKSYPKGDFSDYIISQSRTLDEFLTLVQDTEPEKIVENVNENEYQVILSEASKSYCIDKRCLIKNVLCCGKDTSPFGVPKKFQIICRGDRNQAKCSKCSLITNDVTKTLPKDDVTLINMVKVNQDHIKSTLKKISGVNRKCYENSVEIDEYYNVENIRLVPQISYNMEEDYEHVYRNAFYVLDEGKYIQTNKSYSLKAITTVDQKTQYVVHQIYDISDGENNLDNFKLDNDMVAILDKFRVNYSKGQTIDEKVDDIYDEFSKLSRIYGREDVFKILDLSFHSVLSFRFQDKMIGKGWVEVCIMGDSSTGKSSQGKFLCHHYRAGEIVNGEGASYTGLIGGISQNSGVWSLQWGSFPLNDRGLVMVDESSGIKEEDMAKFSDIRSSGEAKIQKIITEKTRARTRIIWMGNPRKANLGIKNYTYGVNTIKELFGMPEDVRRLDAAIICAAQDIGVDVINKRPDPIVPKYDSNSCHTLIKFAWSRKNTDIYISEKTEKHILEKAKEISGRYSPSIPLIEPADMRNKIARMAVSIAVRLFNINEKRQVIVQNDHVDYVVNLLDKIYSSDAFGYRRFSLQDFQKDTLKDPREVVQVFGLEEEYKIDELLNSPTIGKSSMISILNDDFRHDFTRMTIEEKKRRLKRNNAVREFSNYYVIQPGLIRLLKELKIFFETRKDESIDDFLNKYK